MRICSYQLAFTTVMTGAFACQTAEAQVHHRHHHHTSHHHHDAMGHRVDDAGHHIDRHGHHTGAVGVYDNGARSLHGYGNYYGYNGYRPTGAYLYASPTIGVIATQPQGYVQPPVYAQPQTYAQPLAVAPQQAYVPSNQIGNGLPPQNTLPGGMTSGGKIVIFNPADSGGDVRYSLNGAEYAIQPGYSQTLNNDRSWVVSFGSGGPKGDVRYTLSPGNFKFKATETGWDLMRTADQPTVAQLPLVPAPAPSPQQP